MWAEQQINALANDDVPEARIKIKKIKALLDFALKSQHNSRLEAMLNQAKSETRIPIMPEAMDANPMLFNFLNGTYDLSANRLRPHDPADYITKLCPMVFDPDAQCPVFLKTINGIFKNDALFIDYVQRFLGYCLTGNVKEDSVPIAWGGGSNGKTLLFMLILEVMGKDYAGMVPEELMMESNSSQHPCLKVDLFGKRLMIAAETGEGSKLNEKRFKSITGKDRIKARGIQENFWEFPPTHKLIVCTNHKPKIQGTDDGVWRRVALWPFGIRFWDKDKGESGPPELQADKELGRKLQAEHQGIMAWLVKGCAKWQRDGMHMPKVVQDATKSYRSAEDTLGAFLTDRCNLNSELRAKVSELYGVFTAWCKANGEEGITSKAFGDAMTERGFHKDGGKRWYIGLALASREEDE